MTLTQNKTPQGLLSVMGGFMLATSLVFMIQLLSAVQNPGAKENSPIIINLLELPQVKTPVKTQKKPSKKAEIKTNRKIVKTKKTRKPEQINKNKKPDTNKLSPQAIENNTSKTSELIKNDSAPHSTVSLPSPVPFYKLSDLPRFIHRETPSYPEDMRASGYKGTVELMVLIDKTGKVRKITILKSAGKSFDQAAIKAINASSFMPAKVNGKPVTALLKMPVKFKLL